MKFISYIITTIHHSSFKCQWQGFNWRAGEMLNGDQWSEGSRNNPISPTCSTGFLDLTPTMVLVRSLKLNGQQWGMHVCHISCLLLDIVSNPVQTQSMNKWSSVLHTHIMATIISLCGSGWLGKRVTSATIQLMITLINPHQRYYFYMSGSRFM